MTTVNGVSMTAAATAVAPEMSMAPDSADPGAFRQNDAELFRRAAIGDTVARNRLVEQNLGLVYRVARGYDRTGEQFEDLVAEGALGLMHAIGRFDPGRGYAFSTYAMPWIHYRIDRYLQRNTTQLKISSTDARNAAKVHRARVRLERERGCEITPQMLANKLGMSTDAIVRLLAISRMTVSLDAPIGDTDNLSFHDRVGVSDHTADNLQGEQNFQLIEEALNTLPPRTAALLRARFGLGDGEARSLRAIGHGHDLSGEAVRRIILDGLAQLRSHFSERGVRLEALLDECAA